MTKLIPDPVLSPEALSMIERSTKRSTFDAYVEHLCADMTTQSELWSKSIKALQKYSPQNLRLSEKEGTVQTMMYEQDPEPVDHMSMEPNWHYAVADMNPHSQEDYEGTQATLALAFEQRTANLLAFFQLDARPSVYKIIEERLGL